MEIICLVVSELSTMRALFEFLNDVVRVEIEIDRCYVLDEQCTPRSNTVMHYLYCCATCKYSEIELDGGLKNVTSQ